MMKLYGHPHKPLEFIRLPKPKVMAQLISNSKSSENENVKNNNLWEGRKYNAPLFDESQVINKVW